MADLTGGEIGLIALLVALIVIAPKIPRIGEALGGLFEKRPPDAGSRPG